MDEAIYGRVRESLKFLPKYVRVNTLAIQPEAFLEIFPYALEKTALPFMFRLREKSKHVKIGATPEFKAGLIHAQSLSSALVPLAFSAFSEKDVILDVAAAPGSKTSEMAMLMKNRGLIVANDRKEREKVIIGTLSRLGVVNTVITHHDGKRLPSEWKGKFTKVLLDAPCSALGSWLNAWERFERAPQIPKRLSNVQKKLILSAFDALKPGGELIYSTCTITPEENEAVVDHLLQNRPEAKLLKVELPMPFERGLSEYESSAHVARIYPWHVNSEAFFIAKITRKK